MIGLDSGPDLSCHRIPTFWPHDDRRTDRTGLYVVVSRCSRRQSVPNDCCHRGHLGTLGPSDCGPVCWSNQRDHRCTVPYWCCPPPAWAQNPSNHQLEHRSPGMLELEELEAGLLAVLQPWDRRVGSVRQPENYCQYRNVSHVQPHGRPQGFPFLTNWLLNLSMTRSAPSLVWNSISAITIGCVLMIRHLLTSPPTGVIALSRSPAVVPGARFCAMTTNGPASPRMVIPLFNGCGGGCAATC